MPITVISRMQQRQGLRADLPANLASAEFGWCLDTRELFIGNGPGFGGNTEVLTEHSPNDTLITNRFKTYNAEIATAVVRTLGSKLNDIANIKDFGAVGDGDTNDAPAINAAINSLLFNAGVVTNSNIATRVTLRFPAGVYRIAAPILLYPYLTIIGEGMGKTIILADNEIPISCLMQTADSWGQVAGNIGVLPGSMLPNRIMVSDLTLSTNSLPINIALLDRYQNIKFENVEFVGSYVLGDADVNPHTGAILNSIGDGIDTYNAQFIRCEFNHLTWGIYSGSPIKYTLISGCTFHDVWMGIETGPEIFFGGPYWMTVSDCNFYDIEYHGIGVYSTNPGITSTSNRFLNCGIIGVAFPIYWFPSSTLNSSIGDVFDVVPGVLDQGTDNLIANAQQSNLPGSGTVTSIDINGTSTGLIFTGGPITTTGNLTLGGILDVNNGGTGLLTTPTNGQLLIGNGVGYTLASITAGTGITVTNGSGNITISAPGVGSTGTVTSVNGSGGTTGLTVNGGPITVSGTLTLGGTLSVTAGGTGISVAPTNGQILIGNGTGYNKTTLTAGANVSITNSSGNITIDATGGFNGGIVTNISNSNVATSTTSGALRIIGGVGLGGNLHVGGNVVTGTAQTQQVLSSSNLKLASTVRVEVVSSPFRLASFTTAARNALTGSSNGDMIYNTDLNKFQGYQNGSWVDLS